MSFPTYIDYANSPITWLLKQPKNWRAVPVKVITTINDDTLTEGFDPEYEIEYVDIGSVSLMNGIEKTDSMTFGESPSRARRLPREGDVLVSTVRTYLKAIAPVTSPPENLVASTGFAVIRPKPELKPGFLKYALQEEHFIQEVISRSTGVSYPAINASDIGRILICVPSQDEQLAISNFLEQETSKIDSLIREQERLIKLLLEKRQAVISHAATKGLDPNVPLKDSGVEWLGEVPAHWEALPIFRAARQDYKCFTDGDWIESPFITNGGIRLIQTGNIGIGTYREKGFRFISSKTFDDLNCTEVEPGDLLICRLDGPVGRACLAPDLGVKMITSVDNAILKTRENVSAEFLMNIFSSVQWLEWIQAICRVGGGFRLRISRTQLGEQRICLPPIEEQIKICNQIRSESQKIDSLVASAHKSIELLTERRSALISAAVTGQIDVRGLVPKEEVAA